MRQVALIVWLATVMAGCSSTKLTEELTSASTAQSESRAATVASVHVGHAQVSTEGPQQTAHVIYFDYDSHTIKQEAKSIVERHAQYLRAHPQRKLQLDGHTDERGGREYNLGLGQKRAEAVQRALGFLGIPATQVESVSFGKEKPVAQGADEPSWAKNRRAEFIYR